MKIAVNKCYGGFALSEKATLRMAELKGIKLAIYYEYMYFHSDGEVCVKYFKERQKDADSFSMAYYLIVDTKKTELDELEMANYLTNEGSYYKSFYEDSSRVDSELIQTIEELGEEANSSYSNIKIVEIPDGSDFSINEYDGMETIYYGKSLKTI